MANPAAQIGALKTQAEQFEKGSKEARRGQQQIESALDKLKKNKKDYEGKLDMMHGGVAQINKAIDQLKSHPAGESHPEIAAKLKQLYAQKSQLIEQIAMVRKAIKEMKKQMSELQRKRGEIIGQAEALNKASKARRDAYEKYAGMMAQQVRTNQQRESGKLKG